MKTLLYNFYIASFLLVSIVSCTDDFEDVNTNPLGVSQKQSEADFSNLKAPFKKYIFKYLSLYPDMAYTVTT
ncbi:hypothetical protein [Aquimarina intermedia]|uniref:SusD/RagB-like outer membrane lipoprotein n=1 Tax=Aquimarina intermedia TaxID=350814 RepID=A0A5S5C8V2_9FLAO|nr:hypothetical protein [Aquimarina intermedia]TYP75835.1 SusD/RagB-like outer membrane lipoprotein [Aquimarina intermedia]